MFSNRNRGWIDMYGHRIWHAIPAHPTAFHDGNTRAFFRQFCPIWTAADGRIPVGRVTTGSFRFWYRSWPAVKRRHVGRAYINVITPSGKGGGAEEKKEKNKRKISGPYIAEVYGQITAVTHATAFCCRVNIPFRVVCLPVSIRVIKKKTIHSNTDEFRGTPVVPPCAELCRVKGQ